VHVVFACGGTAGHVYPALAVAEELRRESPGLELQFLGTRHGLECRLVPQHGHPLTVVPGAPFLGTGPLGKLRALGELLAGFLRARRLFQESRPDLVLGFGGYASAGALFAAASLRIPTAIHESNIVPGLANRLLALLVDRVYLGPRDPRWRLPAGKGVVTGTPVRQAIRDLAGQPTVPGSPIRVLVTGGSQGSRSVNERVPELLGALQRSAGLPLEVMHQTGGPTGPVEAAYRERGIAARVVAYLDDMAAAYAAADFVIAPSGAGTLAELAASGRPCLLLPLAASAHDHQRVNADAMAAAGAAWCAPEAALPEGLAPQIAHVLRDPAAYQERCRSLRRFAAPDAARTIARDVTALVTRTV